MLNIIPLLMPLITVVDLKEGSKYGENMSSLEKEMYLLCHSPREATGPWAPGNKDF